MRPTRKVGYGALAAAITAILVWALNKWANAEIDTTMGMSINVVVTAITQYVIPDADDPAPSEGPGQTAGGQPPPKL